MKYELRLVNEKLGLYNRISWILVIIHCLFLCYLSFFSESYRNNALAGLILVALVFILSYFLKKKKWFKTFDLFFLVFGVIWIYSQLYWLAIIPLVFYFLSGVATVNKLVIVTEPGIYYPSFPPKNFQWNDLSNVILKDGILTIDHKNNRVIQQMITEETEVNEKDFNEFCRNKLVVPKQYKNPENT